MKQTTHVVFSIGLSLHVLSEVHSLNAVSFAGAVWLSLSVNFVIDLLGHVRRNGVPTRSWVTHSLLTAPVCGGLLGWLNPAIIFGFLPSVSVWVIIGSMLAAGHLLLDSMTGGGVFLIRRRLALAHFRYDNQLLNLAFVAMGMGLVVASFRV